MSLKNLNEIYRDIKSTFDKVRQIPDFILPEIFKKEYEKYILMYNPDNFSMVLWNKYSAVISTKNNLKIFLPNQWFIIGAMLYEYLFTLQEYRDIVDKLTDGLENKKEILTQTRDTRSIELNLLNSIKLYSWQNQEDKSYIEKFLTDYDWWGGGKTVDRGDSYVSTIMSLGNFLAETQSGIAKLAKQFSKKEIFVNYLKPITDRIRGIANNVGTKDEYVNSSVNESHPLPKPFLLLAGISGTGKTRFVRKQAELSARQANIDPQINYCCVSVRPDWHEPSDLLGYVSRISGKAEYVPTQFLQFIIDAWKYATDDNGEIKPFQNQIPFWLCLDEMNLAPVEQYFADFLSVLESRIWDDGEYRCDPLLSKAKIDTVSEEELKEKLKLNTGNSKSESLWERFKNFGIAIPPNLIVAGTVNMDETTHGFSRKVIDRALTFDFGEFFPNNYNDYFQPKYETKQFGTFSETHIDKNNFHLLADVQADPDGSKTIAFLDGLNDLLRGTPFELAFRALNELLLSIVCFKPKSNAELQAVWDDFLMMKVLPRIDGDSDKLSYVQTNKSISNEVKKELNTEDDSNLLIHIYAYLTEKLDDIRGENKVRPDLFRTDTADSSNAVTVPCRSVKKISWMIKRFKANGFTSFWP